jgi:protease II
LRLPEVIKDPAVIKNKGEADHAILLHCDTAAGHSGGTPAGKQIENTADELGYPFWQLGVGGKPKTEPAKGN